MARRSKRRPRRGRLASVAFVVVVAVLILLFRLYEETGPERHPLDRFVISKVFDGDTVELKGGDRLRLVGIDTPEEGEWLYDEAKAFVVRLTLGKRGELTYGGRRRDRYGRLLGYLYVDSLFVNRAVIDSGYGYVYLFRDNDLDSAPIVELLQAQRSAIERKVGLWGLPYTPERFYVTTPSSFRLHRPECRSVADLPPERTVIYQTREEGMALGLSPCRNCRP